MFSVEVSDDDSEGPYVAAVIYRLSGTKFGGGIYFCPGRSRIWLPETCMGRCGWRLGSGIGLVLLRVRSRMWRHSLVAPSRCLSRRFHHLLPHRFLHMRSRGPLLVISFCIFRPCYRSAIFFRLPASVRILTQAFYTSLRKLCLLPVLSRFWQEWIL